MWFLKYNFRPDIIFQCKDIRVYPALTYWMCHSVAISTIVLKLNEVNVYYSTRPALTDSLKRQISDIFYLPIQKKKVTLKYEQFHYYLLILLFTYVSIVIVNHKLVQLVVSCLLLYLSQF